MNVRAKRSLLAGAAATAAVGVAAAYVLATAGPVAARPFATLDVLQGDAQVQVVGTSIFREARDGQTLHQGDTIRTAAGRAEIEYFDGSVTRLDRRTTFTLAELAATPERSRIVGEQASGATFSRVVELTASDSRFDLETPSAVASVRGTVFFTEVRPDGSELVGVLKGELLVSTEEGEARVIAGRGVTVTGSGELSPPFVLTAADLSSDWLFYNLCVLDHVIESCHRVPPEIQVAEAPEPRPGAPAVVEFDVAQTSTPAPTSRIEEEQEGEDPPPPTPPPPPQEQEPPPPPPPPPPPDPPPPPPSPEPQTHPGSPPCDNPGQGTPCEGPGNAGFPPGNGGTPPGHTKNS